MRGPPIGYIEPPPHIPLLLRFLLFFAERRLGKGLVANRILAWYPRLFIGSGVMESLVAHDEPDVPRRLLGLIRLYTSFLVSCPFCIDMNAHGLGQGRVSDEEIKALQGTVPFEQVSSFDQREKAALAFVKSMCSTPLAFPTQVVEQLRKHFAERAIVIIAGTCAQVNFWARLIQGLGVSPAGFCERWPALNLDAFATRK